MTGILVAVILATTFVWFWTQTVPLISRWLALQELKLQTEVESNKKPALKPADPMPPDLLMYINNEAAGWAREDAAKSMNEIYAETGNWDEVRKRWLNSH